jgi:hypothetical protein
MGLFYTIAVWQSQFSGYSDRIGCGILTIAVMKNLFPDLLCRCAGNPGSNQRSIDVQYFRKMPGPCTETAPAAQTLIMSHRAVAMSHKIP